VISEYEKGNANAKYRQTNAGQLHVRHNAIDKLAVFLLIKLLGLLEAQFSKANLVISVAVDRIVCVVSLPAAVSKTILVESFF
jgi:hypothetical protein